MADFEIEAVIPEHHDGSDIRSTIEGAGGSHIHVSDPGWGRDNAPQTWAWADVTLNTAPVVQDALQRRFPGTQIVERPKR